MYRTKVTNNQSAWLTGFRGSEQDIQRLTLGQGRVREHRLEFPERRLNLEFFFGCQLSFLFGEDKSSLQSTDKAIPQVGERRGPRWD